LLPLALQLGSGILEGYVHFLSILILEARNVGRGTEGLSKEKEKEVTSFELINYLQNEDIQKSLGAMREQDLTIEKLA
jgi:hypothetical protein